MAITITSALCDSWKKEVLMGTHLFKASSGDTFKMLLLKATASGSGTYNSQTTNVGTPGSSAPSTSNVGTDENAGTGYTSNGFTMTPNADPGLDTTNHVAYIDWTTDPNWTSSTITSIGAVLYNSTASNKSVAVFSFTTDQSSSNGTFTVQLPAPAYNTALIRLA